VAPVACELRSPATAFGRVELFSFFRFVSRPSKGRSSTALAALLPIPLDVFSADVISVEEPGFSPASVVLGARRGASAGAGIPQRLKPGSFRWPACGTTGSRALPGLAVRFFPRFFLFWSWVVRPGLTGFRRSLRPGS
jgi:hypothetical protein